MYREKRQEIYYCDFSCTLFVKQERTTSTGLQKSKDSLLFEPITFKLRIHYLNFLLQGNKDVSVEI